METSIKLLDPIKKNDSMYISNILCDDDTEYTFQTSKNSATLCKEKNRIKILVDVNTKKIIDDISTQAVNIVSEHSEKWFNKQLSLEDCNAMYKDALNQGYLYCFYDQDTYFYDSKSRVDLEKLKNDIQGIALLTCRGVVFTKTSFYLKLDVVQFKVKVDKKVNFFNDYIIIDKDEDNQPLKKYSKETDELSFF